MADRNWSAESSALRSPVGWMLMQFVGLQRTADVARFILPFGERQNQCTRPVAMIPLTDIAWVHRTDTKYCPR